MASVQTSPERDSCCPHEDGKIDSSKEASCSSSRSSSKSRDTPGPLPQYQYSRNELLSLRSEAMSKKRPACLDTVYNNSSGMWDPDRWFVGKRREDSPLMEEGRGSKRERVESESDVLPVAGQKRRTPDPKDRIKEERDDIVLSPQRRSFGTGCHVIQPSPLVRQNNSSSDLKDNESTSHREPSRRIGSGRIIRDSRDQRDWDRDLREREYGYGGSRDRREDNRYSNRYSNDRRSRGRSEGRIDEEEEPEWFIGGPTSQHETIELVGFDGISEEAETKRSTRKTRRSRENTHRQNAASENVKKDENSGSWNTAFQGCTEALSCIQEQNPNDPNRTREAENPSETEPSFDLNEIFQMDWCPGLLPNGTPPDQSSQGLGGSRFSQWFKRESPPVVGSNVNSRRSSLQDELVAHVLSEIGEPHLMIPSPPTLPTLNSDSYFTPISPALPEGQQSVQGMSQPVALPKNDKNILDILRNANINVDSFLINGDTVKSAELKEHTLAGKAKSVEELEADLKQLVLGNKSSSNGASSKKVSYNNFFTQNSNGQVGEDRFQNLVNQHSPQPPQQIVQHTFVPNGSSINPASVPTCHVLENSGRSQPDIVTQFLRRQQQASNSVNQAQASVDALAKILGVENNCPTNSLVSPTQPQAFSGNSVVRQQEMMSNLLKQQPPLHPTQTPLQRHSDISSGMSSLGVPAGLVSRQSPLHDGHQRVPSPLVIGQHSTTVNQGPLQMAAAQSTNTLQVQNPAVLARVPSPQELAAHTQSILQSALIKKLLEEQKQKENFRKRQEAQRSHSPNVQSSKSNTISSPSKSLSPTMASFTPTSVMRKMHLEKQDKERSDGGKIPGSPGIVTEGGVNSIESSTSVFSQGRPIVKGNLDGPHNKPKASGKPFVHAQGSLLRSDMVPNNVDLMNKLMEQQRLLQQQQALAAQRQMNTSPMPPSVFGLGPRPPPVGTAHGSSNLVRPSSVTLPPAAVNLPFRMTLVHSNLANSAAARQAPINQIPQLSPLAAIQQQQQQRGISNTPGSGFGVRQLQALAQGVHPVALHQLLLSAHASNPTQVMGSVNTGPNRDAMNKVNQLAPGQQNTNRQSPVNLSKWFGSDVLRQKMPEMPPVPHQNALLVEEVERQQQQATTVRN